MIQPLSRTQFGDYFLIPEADYTRKIDAIYDERSVKPEFRDIWLSLFQWEIVQEDENGDPLPPIIYTPTFEEVAKRLSGENYNAPQWQTVADAAPLRLMTIARLVAHEGQLDTFIDNMGNGIDADYLYGGSADQFHFVAEPIPSEI